MTITLPRYLNDFLGFLMGELDGNKSEVIESIVIYITQNQQEFLEQFSAWEEEEDFEEEEGEEEEED